MVWFGFWWVCLVGWLGWCVGICVLFWVLGRFGLCGFLGIGCLSLRRLWVLRWIRNVSWILGFDSFGCFWVLLFVVCGLFSFVGLWVCLGVLVDRWVDIIGFWF